MAKSNDTKDNATTTPTVPADSETVFHFPETFGDGWVEEEPKGRRGRVARDIPALAESIPVGGSLILPELPKTAAGFDLAIKPLLGDIKAQTLQDAKEELYGLLTSAREVGDEAQVKALKAGLAWIESKRSLWASRSVAVNLQKEFEAVAETQDKYLLGFLIRANAMSADGKTTYRLDISKAEKPATEG